MLSGPIYPVKFNKFRILFSQLMVVGPDVNVVETIVVKHLQTLKFFSFWIIVIYFHSIICTNVHIHGVTHFIYILGILI